MAAVRDEVTAGSTLIVTVFEAALYCAVAVDAAVIFTVPAFFAVTFPVDLSTAAIVVSEDLNDLVPLAPVTDTDVVCPANITGAPAFAVMDWAALATFTVIVFEAALYWAVGTIMRLGLELLHDVSKLELDDDCRELFQDYCEDCLKKKILSGWDWDFDIYECLIALLQTPKEARKLIKRIESDEYLAKDYNAEHRMKLILRLTEKADGKEAAQRLMKNNLHIEDFRRQAITEAVEAKDFAKAYHLGEEGIALDLDHRPSRVSTWNHCLLKVAQVEHNREKTIDYARHLYIEPYYEEGDFYAILKKNVPKEQWEAFVRKLADDVLKSRTPERYAKICSSEGWHQELMDFVRRQSRIGLLQEYEKQLLPYYRNEIIECYVHYIYRLMEYSRGRDTYREICNHLRHISSYGAKNLATETATDLRTKYRRCRALVDELDHISFDS